MNDDFALSLIRTVPDFKKKGIQFRDIGPLIEHGSAFRHVVDRMSAPYLLEGIDKIAAIEARGFIFAAAMAMQLGGGVVMLRKPGLLPSSVARRAYDTEYSKDILEIHEDSIQVGERVIIVDDILATGGTVSTAFTLLHELGANVIGCSFLIELVDCVPRGRPQIEARGHKMTTVFQLSDQPTQKAA